ncbi:hypothetical protein VSQ48_20120 [Candidatus Ventrimonas sp. KK005]
MGKGENAQEQKLEEIRSKNILTQVTPVGTLKAYLSSDPENPGIYIDLEQDGDQVSAPLAVVEYSGDQKVLHTLVWGDINHEDYDCHIDHCGIDTYFSE